MTLLESGPAKTDRLYWLVVGLVFSGYAGWSVYDGAIRYFEQNRQEAQKYVQQWTKLPVDFERSFTEADFERVRKSEEPPTLETIHQEFGLPLPPKQKAVGPPDVERFVSVYGMVTVPLERGERVSVHRMEWLKWHHSPDDIRVQYYMAVVVGAVALFLLYRAFKAARLCALIDEEGLTYGGRRIAFAEMVSLRDYNSKGWVDLYYRLGNGDDEKKLRIDNQKIAKFDEIVELICEKKGFTNPVTTPEEPEEEKEEAESDTGQDSSIVAEDNEKENESN